MTRKYNDKVLVLATHNTGKVNEIKNLLNPLKIKSISARDLNIPEPIEDGLTFIENAEIKSRASARTSGFPALADDSGLVVPILDGDPGIYSARWAFDPIKNTRNFSMAINKIEKTIQKKGENISGQPAHFVCALSLCWPDGDVETVEGVVSGSLTFPPKGSNGFGYDPIFIPENHVLTFGQMTPKKKDLISHRTIAFKKLVEKCFT